MKITPQLRMQIRRRFPQLDRVPDCEIDEAILLSKEIVKYITGKEVG